MNCVPEKTVTHLNEQNVSSLSEAAVVADEFALTYQSVFLPACVQISAIRSVQNVVEANKPSPILRETRECFYCHEVGHLISVPSFGTKKAKITTCYL